MLQQIFSLSFMTAFLAAAVRLAVPLMYGGIGETIAEKIRYSEYRNGRCYAQWCIFFPLQVPGIPAICLWDFCAVWQEDL